MNHFSLSTIIFIPLIFLAVCLLSIDLYTSYKNRGLSIKIKRNLFLTIFWFVFLIIWTFALAYDLNGYINNQENISISGILSSTFWILFSLSYLIKSWRGNEIGENGIYHAGNFYKWSKIESYDWILENTIRFKLRPSLKFQSSVEFDIKEENRPDLEEILKRKLSE
ncbi:MULTISPECIES: DUF5673 domain-containing protein [Clostridium]|uniref:DUF5673 domain-containing protein n=1 Tax=Clostridium cibarium TaxID=2762247 RepID=A0ABR8PW94_9CLOT|nr:MULTISPECIES: DUF5673 domain-containing protein [Clostridium]MBD7912441.1 hypothetical protein [Clostridium cibarium]